jgi:transmembrane sensor
VIAEQAATWFVAHREKSLTEEQRQAFLSWLQASPLHVREYLGMARLSLDLRAAARATPESTEALVAAAIAEPVQLVAALPLQRAARLGPQRTLTALAAMLAAVTIGTVTWWQLARSPQHEDFRTAHGEQRTVRLEDGSVLHINSDSVVQVDFVSSERRVIMERGQALFKVAKDKTRPFRVRVGSTEIVAVGTEFDIRRSNDSVLVTVVEGQVAVAKLENSQAPALSVNAMTLRLAAGEQARIAMDAIPIVKQAIDVRPAVAWAQQRILFDRQSLEEVIAEFNRYGTTQIVIEDSEVAGLRVSGTFNAYDLDSFLLYLENLNGLEVQRDAERIRISLTKK